MPRTKGSKNKVKQPVAERIAAVKQEISQLEKALKEKKTELKKLEAEKVEEDKQRLWDAVVASGKSVDDVIAMIAAGK